MPLNEIILTPPADFGPEAKIGGTIYVPDLNGLVRTTNVDHAETMQRMHGFTITGADTVKADPLTMGLMQVDEMGKTALLTALVERSVDVSAEMVRGELEALAAQWNTERRAGTLQKHGSPAKMEPVVRDSFPMAQPAAIPQNQAQPHAGIASTAAPNIIAHAGQVQGATETKPDFAGMHYASLNKWLKEHGIEAGALDTAGKVRVAESHWAAHGNGVAGTGEVL